MAGSWGTCEGEGAVRVGEREGGMSGGNEEKKRKNKKENMRRLAESGTGEGERMVGSMGWGTGGRCEWEVNKEREKKKI